MKQVQQSNKVNKRYKMNLEYIALKNPLQEKINEIYRGNLIFKNEGSIWGGIKKFFILIGIKLGIADPQTKKDREERKDFEMQVEKIEQSIKEYINIAKEGSDLDGRSNIIIENITKLELKHIKQGQGQGQGQDQDQIQNEKILNNYEKIFKEKDGKKPLEQIFQEQFGPSPEYLMKEGCRNDLKKRIRKIYKINPILKPSLWDSIINWFGLASSETKKNIIARKKFNKEVEEIEKDINKLTITTYNSNMIEDIKKNINEKLKVNYWDCIKESEVNSKNRVLKEGFGKIKSDISKKYNTMIDKYSGVIRRLKPESEAKWEISNIKEAVEDFEKINVNNISKLHMDVCNRISEDIDEMSSRLKEIEKKMNIKKDKSPLIRKELEAIKEVEENDPILNKIKAFIERASRINQNKQFNNNSIIGIIMGDNNIGDIGRIKNNCRGLEKELKELKKEYNELGSYEKEEVKKSLNQENTRDKPYQYRR